jgi:hypothetical protein
MIEKIKREQPPQVFNFLKTDLEPLYHYSDFESADLPRKISKGMIFLELLTEVYKTNNNNILMEHLRKIVPHQLIDKFEKANTEEEKANFVLQCLSCKTFDKQLKRSLCKNKKARKYAIFKKLMVNIYDEVLDGTFERKKYWDLIPYINKLIIMMKREKD